MNRAGRLRGSSSSYFSVCGWGEDDKEMAAITDKMPTAKMK